MIGKYGKFIISVCIGGLFLWLAFRNVDLHEVWESMTKMSYGWIPFYIMVTILAHYARAERWRLLFDKKDHETLPSRTSLFNGVMLGYLVNYAIPRLGEISRAVYITKKEGGSNSKAIGAIFLERFVDTFVLLLLLGFITFYVIADPAAIRTLFGDETIEFIKLAQNPLNIALVFATLLALLFLIYAAHLTLKKTGSRFRIIQNIYHKILEIGLLFTDGLLSLRRVPNWPLFVLTTFFIWFGYVLLAYIPFYGFGMVSEFNLGLREAFVIMTVSAIGVALPSPGGVGTYHWFVGQTLIVIYMMPPALSMAYAFVTHAVMFFTVVLITSFCFLILEHTNLAELIKKIQKNVE